MYDPSAQYEGSDDIPRLKSWVHFRALVESDTQSQVVTEAGDMSAIVPHDSLVPAREPLYAASA